MPIRSKKHAGAPALVAPGRASRDARKERGISQEELAHLAQIDRSYMSGIERGLQNPSVITYVVIAESIGVPFGALVVAANI